MWNIVSIMRIWPCSHSPPILRLSPEPATSAPLTIVVPHHTICGACFCIVRYIFCFVRYTNLARANFFSATRGAPLGLIKGAESDMSTPTEETYSELQTAYAHFNHELFGSQLPPCLITLQRRKGTFGYLSAARFVNHDGEVTDEIAMNPAFFAARDVSETLSTLVHEMVHLWQCHFGQASRNGYHNKQWARQMLKVGLQPTDTGEPGGKDVGQRVTHYIIENGPFDQSCRRLLSEEFQVSWRDRFIERVHTVALSPGSESPTAPSGIDPGIDAPLPPGIIDPETTENPRSSKSKAKFTCVNCGVNAWGKPSLNLVCGDCSLPLVPA